MIIHCLGCGKCVSSNGTKCPYCTSEISDLTLEMNGIQQAPASRSRVAELVLGLVQKSA